MGNTAKHRIVSSTVLPKVYHPKVYVAQTEHTGLGLFSKCPIRKGEILFRVRGVRHRFAVHNAQDSAQFPNWLGIAHGIWLEPKSSSPFNYINHSCEPNAGILGSVTIVALRALRAHEQVTFDYGTSEDDPHWSLTCKCMHPTCRKKIRAIQYLPRDVFERYLPYVPHYFARVYTTVHQTDTTPPHP